MKAPSTGERQGRIIAADEALHGTRMLVVLGGPGSGKTWQAHRYARQAAQVALSSLEDDAALEEVEIPLFTTWDHWVQTGGPGGTRESLVAASLSSGIGHTDPEPADSLTRLARTLSQPTTRLLLVVDSLDEAADLTRQGARLSELISASGSRVVVTSRPAAWTATARVAPSGPEEPLVVDMMPLEYPEDVEGFVREWFGDDPVRGEALLRQLRARSELRQAAVVPLLLTFYCLITETATDVDAPLPVRRRLLYQRLVKRLLRSGWTLTGPGTDAEPDDDQCVELLSQWAWSAVRDRVTPAGVGNWGDAFLQPNSPPLAIARPIDHVATKIAVDGEGGTTRRFVHRTLLEHFVAMHIAGLDVDDAAEELLSHLWFDPDWQAAAPAAIAAHVRRGQLLQRLLHRAGSPGADDAHRAANGEIDRLLLAIAAESEPDDWPSAEGTAINQCRARSASTRPAQVARSAHWTDSNNAARAWMLAALPTADLSAFEDLVTALPGLSPTEAERAEARAAVLVRAAVLAALHTGRPEAAGVLVAALPGLAPTEAERAKALATKMAAPTTADHRGDFGDPGAALRALAPTEPERAEACATVLTALRTVDTWAVGALVALLTGLDPRASERAEARATVLAALHTVDPWRVGDLTAVLQGLVRTEEERAEARAAVLVALRTADPRAVGDLATVLQDLVCTEAEQAEARSAVLARAAALATLPADDAWTIGGLLTTLPGMGAIEGERAEARAALLAALRAVEPWAVGDMVAVLIRLEPLEAERAGARVAVLAALSKATSWTAEGLGAALRDLEPTEVELAEARTRVLAALRTADSGGVGELAKVLPRLDATGAELAEARAVVLATIPAAHPLAVGDLVAVLPGLVSTEAERAEARAAVLVALRTASDAWAVFGLGVVLPGLVSTGAERAEARAVVLAALPPADVFVTFMLVTVLPGLVSTGAERAEARAAVLAVLRTADDPFAIRNLVIVLLDLEPTGAERGEARVAVLATLCAADPQDMETLTWLLRRTSPLSEWLGWLADA